MNTPERNTDPLLPVTRAELRTELGPIREALARLELRVDRLEQRMDHLAKNFRRLGQRVDHLAKDFRRLGQRMDHIATKDFPRLEQRMDHLATKEDLARLDARLTWRIVMAMGVLTGIFSAIVAIFSGAVGAQ